MSSNIKKNIIFNIILTTSGIVFPLITYPYITRILGPENMGKISYVSSIINYFQWFSYLGVPIYGIKKCAVIQKDKEALSNLIGELLILNCLSILVSIVIIFSMIFYIPNFFEYKILFFIYTLNLIFTTLNLEWLYKGLEKYDYLAIRSLFFRFLVIIMVFLLIKEKKDYILYAIISNISSILIFIFNIIYIKKYIKKFALKKALRNSLSHLFSAFRFCLITMVTALYTNLDIVMLGSISGDVEVGYYSVAVKIKMILIIFIASISEVILPRVTQYLNKEKKVEFYLAIEEILNLIIILAVPLVIFFMAKAQNCINILAGEDYFLAVKPMIILMPIVLIAGLSSTLGYQVLVPIEKEKQFFYVIIIGVIIDFILNYLWIESYGSTGAAIATLIAESAICLIEIYILRDILKQISLCKTFLKSLFASFIAYLSIKLFNVILSSYEFINLLLSFIIFIFIWYICMIFLKEKLLKELSNLVLVKIGRKIK